MRRTTNGVAAVLAATMLVAACTATDAPEDPPSATDSDAGGTTEDANAAAAGPDQDQDPAAGSATDDTESGTGGADAADPGAFSTVERARETGEPGTLVAVAADTAGDVDTLRFEFDGSLPTYRVGYVERILLGEDEPVDIEGRASLEVAFEESTPGTGGMTSEDVPTNEAYDLPALRHVLLVENLGGAVRFGVGVAREVAFRVVEEDTALVVELEHP